MKIKLFNSCFPEIAADFSHKKSQKINKDEIVGQFCTLSDEKIIYFFKQFCAGCASSEQKSAGKFLKLFPLVFTKFKASKASAESLTKQVHMLVEPLFTKNTGSFPEWTTSLSKFEVPSEAVLKVLHTSIEAQSASDPRVLSYTTIFADLQHMQFHTKPYDHNRLGKGTSTYLNASCTSSLILAGIPQEKKELEGFISALVASKVSVWISLHQVEDVKPEANFFDKKVLAALQLQDGQILEQIKEEEVAKSTAVTTNPPRIVLRELAIVKSTQKVHTLYSLHYEKWADHRATPDVALLNPLCRMAKKLSPKGSPIAINCRAGVGRTSVPAALLTAMGQVEEGLSKGQTAASITINLPQILYSLRCERAGLGTKKQLVSIFQAFSTYAKEVIDVSPANSSSSLVSASTSASTSSSSCSIST